MAAGFKHFVFFTSHKFTQLQRLSFIAKQFITPGSAGFNPINQDGLLVFAEFRANITLIQINYPRTIFELMIKNKPVDETQCLKLAHFSGVFGIVIIVPIDGECGIKCFVEAFVTCKTGNVDAQKTRRFNTHTLLAVCGLVFTHVTLFIFFATSARTWIISRNFLFSHYFALLICST